MSSINSIVKSVQLNPGESFTLPPGASIVGVTGTLSSSCGTLPNPQALTCYGLNFSIVDGSIGGQSTAMSNLTLTGFKINNIDYLFPTEKTDINNGSTNIPLDEYCATTPSLAGLITFVCPTGQACRRFECRGDTCSYTSTFKMLPSFGDNAYLMGYYVAEPVDHPRIDILFKVKPIVDIAFACTCS